MPNQTNSKRISISLNPEVYSVISDLANLQNKPMSRIVVELLEEMNPVLSAVRDGLKEVSETNDKSTALKRLGGALLMEGTEQLGQLSKEIRGL
jgi:predicted DNA-binding protein